MAYSGGRKVQTSTPPDLTSVHPSVSTDHKSASNNVPRTDTDGQHNSVAGGLPQNPVALGPYRGPPRGQQGVVERRPLRRPKEALTQPQNSAALGPYDGPPRGQQGAVERQPSQRPKEPLTQPQNSAALGPSRGPPRGEQCAVERQPSQRAKEALTKPQNSAALGPYRGSPCGQQGAVERQPSRMPKEPLTQLQNSAAPGPYHGPPRGEQGAVERQPSQRPKEPLQFGVPQPSLPQVSPALSLFQDSWAALNDYCGTLIAKMNVDYHHEFPFYMRAAYDTDSATIWIVYNKVVRVLDYMTYVVKQFGTPREKMRDLAEAFIKTLSELLQMLRHEGIPEDRKWTVELEEMMDFLVNPDNKSRLTVGKKQIECLHNSLSHCALQALSSSRR